MAVIVVVYMLETIQTHGVYSGTCGIVNLKSP